MPNISAKSRLVQYTQKCDLEGTGRRKMLRYDINSFLSKYLKTPVCIVRAGNSSEFVDEVSYIILDTIPEQTILRQAMENIIPEEEHDENSEFNKGYNYAIRDMKDKIDGYFAKEDNDG